MARKEKKLSPGEEKLQAIEQARVEAEKPPEPQKPLRLVQELQKLTIRPKGGGLCKLVFDKDHKPQKILVAKFVKHYKLAERGYKKWVEGGRKGPRTWRALWFIILKMRQLGSTTLFMAILYVLTRHHPETTGQLVAHLDNVARRQWNMMKRFYKFDKSRKPLEGDKPTKDGLVYDDSHGSECYAITSGGSHVGHGDTTQFSVLTEFSRWRKPEETLDGIDNSIPSPEETWLSIRITESTANGMANLFKNRWDQAKAGEVEDIPVFIGWKEDRTKRMEIAPNEVFVLDDIEAQFAKDYGLDLEQMKWARWMRNNKCRKSWDKFNEQYPISEEVAWMFSGFPVFDQVKVQRQMQSVRKPVFEGDIIIDPDSDDFQPKLVPQINGPLTIYEMPVAGKDYSFGWDTADGRKQDYTVGKGIRDDTDAEVATYRSNTLYPTNAGIKAVLLGIFYNYAFLGIERTPSGSTALSICEFGLRFDEQRGYPEVPAYPNLYYETIKDKKTLETKTVLGFTTSQKSKKHIIGKLSEAVGEDIIKVNSMTTLIQMQGFVNDPDAIGKKKWMQKNKDPLTDLPNDDDIMALAIAYEMRNTDARNKYFDSGVELVA